jgi:hypothetical protein
VRWSWRHRRQASRLHRQQRAGAAIAIAASVLVAAGSCVPVSRPSELTASAMPFLSAL